MNQSFAIAGTNVHVQVVDFKQIKTHWKWLFEIRGSDENPGPELCIALLTQEKMHEYLAKLRAKGWEVAVWNITEIEEDPYSNLDELLA